MLKNILLCSLFILIFLVPLKQDPNAKTWKNTRVWAGDIIAAIDSGDSVIIDSCEIFGPLTKVGKWEKPDTIRGLLRISGSTFSDSIFFRYCYFLEPVFFEFDTFCRHVNFVRVAFSKAAIIARGTFGTNSNFWGATFGGYTNFEGTTFRGDAYFGEVAFDGKTTFSGATFEEKAGFWLASFATRAYFMFARFDGDALFDSVTFREDAYFSDAIFEGKVDLNLIEFKHIDISWKQLEGHLVYNRTANYKLMKYFEEQRQLADADGIYLFLKDQERMEKPWYVRYPEYWFIQLTCGYGVKPLRTLIVSLLVILFFSAFYCKSNAIKEIEKKSWYPRRPRILRTVRSSFRKRLYDAFYFSVHTFIIGVVSDWHPTDEFLIKTKKIRLFKFRTLSMIEGVLGWVLLVLFVVTLTRKFIR